jgi:hypothetical protein
MLPLRFSEKYWNWYNKRVSADPHKGHGGNHSIWWCWPLIGITANADGHGGISCSSTATHGTAICNCEVASLDYGVWRPSISPFSMSPQAGEKGPGERDRLHR